MVKAESRTEPAPARARWKDTAARFALGGVFLGGIIGLFGTVWSTQAELRHAERSELRAERRMAYHDYLVAHERVLHELPELRQLLGTTRADADEVSPQDLDEMVAQLESLTERMRESEFALTTAADMLYLVGSSEAGQAAVDLIDALNGVRAASYNEAEDAPEQLRHATMVHHVAVAKFNSVARGDLGNN